MTTIEGLADINLYDGDASTYNPNGNFNQNNNYPTPMGQYGYPNVNVNANNNHNHNNNYNHNQGPPQGYPATKPGVFVSVSVPHQQQQQQQQPPQQQLVQHAQCAQAQQQHTNSGGGAGGAGGSGSGSGSGSGPGSGSSPAPGDQSQNVVQYDADGKPSINKSNLRRVAADTAGTAKEKGSQALGWAARKMNAINEKVQEVQDKYSKDGETDNGNSAAALAAVISSNKHNNNNGNTYGMVDDRKQSQSTPMPTTPIPIPATQRQRQQRTHTHGGGGHTRSQDVHDSGDGRQKQNIIEGILYKKTTIFGLGQFKKRFIVIDAAKRTLSSYNDTTSNNRKPLKPSDVIDLSAYSSVDSSVETKNSNTRRNNNTIVNKKHKQQDLCFDITRSASAGAIKHTFRAASLEEKRKWIAFIQSVMHKLPTCLNFKINGIGYRNETYLRSPAITMMNSKLIQKVYIKDWPSQSDCKAVIVVHKTIWYIVRLVIYDERQEDIVVLKMGEYYQAEMTDALFKINTVFINDPRHVYRGLYALLTNYMARQPPVAMLDISNPRTRHNVLSPGDIVRVQRSRGVSHHYGIYIGNNAVVHYCTDSDGDQNLGSGAYAKKYAYVKQTKWEVFQGESHVIQCIYTPLNWFSIPERIEHALLAVKLKYGYGTFSIRNNNCEHWARGVLHGFRHSNISTLDSNNNTNQAAIAGTAVGLAAVASGATALAFAIK